MSEKDPKIGDFIKYEVRGGIDALGYYLVEGIKESTSFLESRYVLRLVANKGSTYLATVWHPDVDYIRGIMPLGRVVIVTDEKELLMCLGNV